MIDRRQNVDSRRLGADDPPPRSQQSLLIALALAPAAAYVKSPSPARASTAVNSRAELESLAKNNGDFLGKTLGFWDPLGASTLDFWGLGEEGTVGRPRRGYRRGRKRLPRRAPRPHA